MCTSRRKLSEMTLRLCHEKKFSSCHSGKRKVMRNWKINCWKKGTQPRKPLNIYRCIHIYTYSSFLFIFLRGLKSFTQFKFIRFCWILFCSHFSLSHSLCFLSYMCLNLFLSIPKPSLYVVFNTTSLCVRNEMKLASLNVKMKKKEINFFYCFCELYVTAYIVSQ